MVFTKRTSQSPRRRTVAAVGAGLLLVAVAAAFGACGSGSNETAKNAAPKNAAPPVVFADKPDKSFSVRNLGTMAEKTRRISAVSGWCYARTRSP